MARRNTRSAAKPARKASTSSSQQTVTRIERVDTSKEESFFERLSASFQRNQSFFNIVLGGLIVVVLGVLLFNYFNQPTEDLAGPGVQNEQTETPEGDVAKENLPGTYTVKEGDTLFSIAQNYYDDGYKYPQIAEANNLTNENAISVGQEITIPKLDDTGAVAQASPSASPEATASPAGEEPLAEAPSAPAAPQAPEPMQEGTGGAENVTAWGEKITADTYTVQAGDWLSKIAGRAYGDVYAYQRIAQANNIANPDAIEVGMTLKIPR